MIDKMITASTKLDLSKKTKGELKWHNIIFIISLLIFPVLSYSAFQLKWVESKPEFSNDLLAPVAMVQSLKGTGSAFLTGNTTLITANHVVEGMKTGDMVKLIFEKANPQLETQAKIIYMTENNQSYETDFAVLQINPGTLPDNFPKLMLGNSDNVSITTVITVIGYPAGLFSITEGKVSNTQIAKNNLFQLDVGGWEGNSGGPVIDKNTNEVIGVFVAGMTGDFKGINAACKINNVTKMMQQKGINITN